MPKIIYQDKVIPFPNNEDLISIKELRSRESWAYKTIHSICAAEGLGVPSIIDIKINRVKDKLTNVFSSGKTFHLRDWDYPLGRILVNSGSDLTDFKLTVLHEATHWILPPKTKHSPKFFLKAFEIYEEYDIPEQFYLAREISYKKRNAAVAAQQMNKPKITKPMCLWCNRCQINYLHVDIKVCDGCGDELTKMYA